MLIERNLVIKKERSTKWCILQGCPDQAIQEEVNSQWCQWWLWLWWHCQFWLLINVCKLYRPKNQMGDNFTEFFFENVTVWHGCSMEYHRVFHEVKPLKISNLHTSMHIWWLLCKWGDVFIYNNQVWLFALQNPETSLCDH